MTVGRQAAEHEPIARVLPMLTVPHLDREFDYLVAADMSDDAQPGVRVKVRFNGRLVDAVAARYAGTRADVLRLAIPPRHATVEKKPPVPLDPLVAAEVDHWREHGTARPDDHPGVAAQHREPPAIPL